MRIHIIASTHFHAEQFDQFLAQRQLIWHRDNPSVDAEAIVEAAGRVCYLSFGQKQYRRGARNYIANLILQGHESVLEHATFSVLAADISRALSHQLVRHRVGFAYSQLSQQYHDESEAEFVAPELLDRDPQLRTRWYEYIQTAREFYRAILDGVSAEVAGSSLSAKERQRLVRSVARSVLPNATSTTLVTTGNARAWRHLLAVRGATPGDLEMRQYCTLVLSALNRLAPNLFLDFEIKGDEIGEFVTKKDGTEFPG